jgi:phage minor structural protein
MPLDDEKFSEIQEENIVKASGQLFIIRIVEEERTGENELLAYVEGEHISSELLGKHIDSIELTAASPNVILPLLLSGTRFTGGASSMSGTHDFTVSRKSATWGLNHLIALSDGELERDNFTVNLKPQVGNDNGVHFRYRKNITGIKRTVDSKGVVTRLYCYGKDDLTIPAIDSPNIGLYPVPKEDKVEFNEITTEAGLQAAGERYLESVDTPKVSYEVTVVELKKAVGYDDSEAFFVGDTVTVFDEDLNLDLKARVVEYEEFPLEPERSRVTLANFIDSIEDTINKLQDAANKVQTFTTKDKLNTYWLDGAINAIVNQIRMGGVFTNAVEIEGQGFLLENNDAASPDFGALYIGPGWILIANAKNPDGSWQWRTALTGKTVNADEIRAGTLQASLVKILGDTNFYWDDTSIYIIDPLDIQKQIRIGKYDGTNYGIGFTTNGGSSWSTAIDFAGITIGPDSTYAPGYDPSTKATQSELDTVEATANSASSTASAAQSTANAAQTTANNSVQQGTLYNGVKINSAVGFEAIRTDNKVKTIMNATEGIKIQRSTDGSTWQDRMYFDTNGNLFIKDAVISVEHSNGAKTVIDGESFKAYMDKNVTDHFVSVDGIGLYRSYQGTKSRFRDALAFTSGSFPSGSQSMFTTGPPSDGTATQMCTQIVNIDLIGGEWIGKATNVQVQLTINEAAGSSNTTDYTVQMKKCELQSVEALPNGIRLKIIGGNLWHDPDYFLWTDASVRYWGAYSTMTFQVIAIG